MLFPHFSNLFVSHAVIIKKNNKDLEKYSSIKDGDKKNGINGLLSQSMGGLGISFSDRDKFQIIVFNIP